MNNEFCLPDEMRAALRAHLPEKAFLRRDRGEGLFITNAPVFDSGICEIPGFALKRQGGMLSILPDAGWISRAEACEPMDELSRSLLRFRGQAPDRENLLLFVHGAKLLDTPGAPEAETDAYDRALRQRSAVALRGGCGGGLYAAAILNARLHHRKGEKQL